MSLSIVYLAEDLAKGKQRIVPAMTCKEWRYFCFWLDFYMGYDV